MEEAMPEKISFGLTEEQIRTIKELAGDRKVRLGATIEGGELKIDYIACNAPFVACNAPFVACNAPFVACNAPFALRRKTEE
jgi:hypothetical protein